MRAETIPAPASPGAGSVLYLFHSHCVSRIVVPFFLPSPERKNKMYPIKWTRGIKKDLGSGHEKGGDVPQKWTEIRIAKPRDGQLWYTGKRGRDIDGAQTQAQQLWPI